VCRRAARRRTPTRVGKLTASKRKKSQKPKSGPDRADMDAAVAHYCRQRAQHGYYRGGVITCLNVIKQLRPKVDRNKPVIPWPMRLKLVKETAVESSMSPSTLRSISGIWTRRSQTSWCVARLCCPRARQSGACGCVRTGCESRRCQGCRSGYRSVLDDLAESIKGGT